MRAGWGEIAPKSLVRVRDLRPGYEGVVSARASETRLLYEISCIKNGLVIISNNGPYKTTITSSTKQFSSAD